MYLPQGEIINRVNPDRVVQGIRWAGEDVNVEHGGGEAGILDGTQGATHIGKSQWKPEKGSSSTVTGHQSKYYWHTIDCEYLMLKLNNF